jgi:hypothetical protein
MPKPQDKAKRWLRHANRPAPDKHSVRPVAQ